MNKNLLFFWIILSSSVCATNFKEPIDPSTLKDKSVSELWLMRNEIFARHGRPFKTYELFAYFSSKKWYKPSEKYSQKLLSKTEMRNAQIILEEEKKRREKDYYVRDGDTLVNFKNVYNIFQYPEFHENEIETLEKYGFVAFHSKWKQLFHLYEQNDYYGIPSFISVDVILQLYHIFFDMSLRRLEETSLYNALRYLCSRVEKTFMELSDQFKDPLLKKACELNVVYFAIPNHFIGNKVELKGWQDSLANKEIELCESHTPWARSPLLDRMFDYSQFIVRGHYTRSEKLKKYFKAMMWLGRAGIEIKRDVSLLQGVLITYILFKYDNLKGEWEKVYVPTAFYVGYSDDLGPSDYRDGLVYVLGEDWIERIEEITKEENMEKLRKFLEKRFDKKVKIRGHGMWGKERPQIRFMGQRFIPDSYIFDRLTILDDRYERCFPNGLDIMAVLGSPEAKRIMLTELKSSWEKWPEYPEKLEDLIEEFNKMDVDEWKKNLYNYWLWCLKAIITPVEGDSFPFFMKNVAWARKSLNTSLGSWSELRHDVILYAKSSCAAECGGGEKVKIWYPEPPKGYVEPNYEFYKRLYNLTSMMQERLNSMGILEHRMYKLFEDFKELLYFLKRVSSKELKNIPLTNEEYAQIQKLGSLIDNLTLRVFDESDWAFVGGPDRYVPVIADVHTCQGECLEVGVGVPLEIYVIVEIEGKLKLTRGAIFSYYEFAQPANARLTDEKWQEMLDKGTAPDMPIWTKIFVFPGTKFQKKFPVYLRSIQPKIPWSKEPGWGYIYYDTGC